MNTQKTFQILFLTVSALIFFKGCSSSTTQLARTSFEPYMLKKTCMVKDEKAPSWVCEESVSKERYLAVAILESDGNLEYTIADARALARADIAEQMNASIKTTSKLLQTSSKSTSQTSLEHNIISKSQANFSVSEQEYLEKLWVSKNKRVFLRLELPKTSLLPK